MRLDYFAASERMMGVDGAEAGAVKVVDSFILDKLVAEASDHAPVGITLALQ